MISPQRLRSGSSQRAKRLDEGVVFSVRFSSWNTTNGQVVPHKPPLQSLLNFFPLAKLKIIPFQGVISALLQLSSNFEILNCHRIFPHLFRFQRVVAFSSFMSEAFNCVECCKNEAYVLYKRFLMKIRLERKLFLTWLVSIHLIESL